MLHQVLTESGRGRYVLATLLYVKGYAYARREGSRHLLYTGSTCHEMYRSLLAMLLTQWLSSAEVSELFGLS